MRKEQAIKNEITKLRKVVKSEQFTTEQKDKAWSVLLAMQWVLSASDYPISPLDFCGIHSITYKQALKRSA